MKKYVAEAYGTGVLVLAGCATAMVGVRYFGNLGIALSFGIAVMAMYYSIGHISGAHINPAVTIAHAASGSMKWMQAWKYILAQMIGALIATAILYIIAIGTVGIDNITFLGQNSIKKGYTIPTAFIAEFIATLVFIKVVLGSQSTKGYPAVAGIVIGLTYAMLHFITMPITGTSLNPARSFGPAVFVGGESLKMLWLFVAAPMLAGLLAGVCHKWFEKLK